MNTIRVRLFWQTATCCLRGLQEILAIWFSRVYYGIDVSPGDSVQGLGCFQAGRAFYRVA